MFVRRAAPLAVALVLVGAGGWAYATAEPTPGGRRT